MICGCQLGHALTDYSSMYVTLVNWWSQRCHKRKSGHGTYGSRKDRPLRRCRKLEDELSSYYLSSPNLALIDHTSVVRVPTSETALNLSLDREQIHMALTRQLLLIGCNPSVRKAYLTSLSVIIRDCYLTAKWSVCLGSEPEVGEG